MDTKSPGQSGAHALTKTKHELFIILTVPSLVPILKSSIALSAACSRCKNSDVVRVTDNLRLLSENTWKLIICSMTVAPGEINLENKLDVIQHAPQKKTARSADSMNDVIAFYTFNTPLE